MISLVYEMPPFIFDLFDGNINIFLLGFLFTLALYHFLFFFQYKELSYLYYSIYTSLIFIYLLPKTNSFFLSEIVNNYKSTLNFINYPIQWAIFISYMFFADEFINLKRYKPKWHTILIYILSLNILALLLLMFYSFFFNDFLLIGNIFYYFSGPFLAVISIIILIVVSNIENNLKHYILIGSSIYLILSIITLYLILNRVDGNIIVFYAAVFIENIFFVLGLGVKQRKNLSEKNLIQEKLIQKHLQNLTLQKKIKSKLDNDVAKKTAQIISLTKKNEEKHKKKIANEFSKKTIDLRMKALQTQMNPHFLFNSLNAIKHFIIKNKREDASYFLGKLSKLLREILEKSQQQEISLKQELEIMKLYLEVENIRLNNNIQLNVFIDSNINPSKINIPPLVLQPFIENAIWHGLALKKGERKIKIGITSDNNILIIQIKDNGIGLKKAALLKKAKLVEKESFGIMLSKERLEAYTEHLDTNISITFEDIYNANETIGTKVIIKIPYIDNQSI